MRTQDARNIHITQYLEKVGARFARTQQGTNGLEHVYHSPVRDDRDASLCVNFERNIWFDAPSRTGGRLIELVCYLNDLPLDSVSEALKLLDQVFPQYRGSGRFSQTQNEISQPFQSQSSPQQSTREPSSENRSTGLKEKADATEIIATREIYWFPLKSYLQERKIPLSLAQKHLKEIEYRASDGRTFKALGWKAGDTYVLRNKHFKGFLGKGASISVLDRGSPEVLVFEGFFDFLSYLVIKKWEKSPLTVIVLNSTAMYPQMKALVSERAEITSLRCFFDRDEAGASLFASVVDDFSFRVVVSDESFLYSNFNDLNDWLVQR